MSNEMINIQPPLAFIPPDFQPGVLQVCQWVFPWWIRFRTPITEIQTENVEQLVELYQQFQQEKIRFMLAFRHPNPDDPLPISQLFWRHIPQQAKKTRNFFKTSDSCSFYV